MSKENLIALTAALWVGCILCIAFAGAAYLHPGPHEIVIGGPDHYWYGIGAFGPFTLWSTIVAVGLVVPFLFFARLLWVKMKDEKDT